MLSRTRLFGVALVLYALLSTGLTCWGMKNYAFNVPAESIVFVGGAIVLLAGVVIVVKEDLDMMKAIGLYGLSFGIYRLLGAYCAMTIDPKLLDLTQFPAMDFVSMILIIISFMQILLGISLLRGAEVKDWSEVIFSSIFIILDIIVLIFAYRDGNTKITVALFIEILMLLMVIALLLSEDMRTGTIGDMRISNEERKAAKKDYDLAMAEAKALRRSGNIEMATRVEMEAKAEYEGRIAESKEVKKDASKKRYVYNPETKKVEVVDDDD